MIKPCVAHAWRSRHRRWQEREAVKELLKPHGDANKHARFAGADAHASLVVPAAGASGSADDDWIDRDAAIVASSTASKFDAHRASGSGASPGMRHCAARQLLLARPFGIPSQAFRSGRDFAAWIGLVPRQRFDRRQTEARANLEGTRRIPIWLRRNSGGGSSMRGLKRTRRQPDKYLWLDAGLHRP